MSIELAHQLFGYVLVVVLALIPIANPFSTAPLFVSMTVSFNEPERHRVAWLACVYMCVVLITFLLLGALILNFFGISLPALRIAGGLIVAYIGFRMLFPPAQLSTDLSNPAEPNKNIAFTPLAMPMLSGPGSISVVMSMAAQVAETESLSNQIAGYAVIAVGIIISALLCWLVLRASSSVVRFLGESGIDALTKIMGFLLVCIGVEFVVAGLRGLGVIG